MIDKPVAGMKIDPDEIAIAAQAVRQAVGNFTYMGVNVGGYITDAECKQVATAVVAAIENYRNSPAI